MTKAGVLTLDSVIHAMFLRVVAVEPGEAQDAPVLVRFDCMGDTDVEDLTLCLTRKRAEEAGLVTGDC